MNDNSQSNNTSSTDGNRNPVTPPDANPVTWETVMAEAAPELRALFLKAGKRYAQSHYGSDVVMVDIDRHANDFIVELCGFLLNILPGDCPDQALTVHQIDLAYVQDWYSVKGSGR